MALANRAEWRPPAAPPVFATPAALAEGAWMGTAQATEVLRASAGDLTSRVLAVYAVALPFYVATEVITRGLIALKDTRSPLVSNTIQLAARAALIAALLDAQGALAIPIAFAVTAAVETLGLGAVLAFRLRRNLATLPMPALTTG